MTNQPHKPASNLRHITSRSGRTPRRETRRLGGRLNFHEQSPRCNLARRRVERFVNSRTDPEQSVFSSTGDRTHHPARTRSRTDCGPNCTATNRPSRSPTARMICSVQGPSASAHAFRCRSFVGSAERPRFSRRRGARSIRRPGQSFDGPLARRAAKSHRVHSRRRLTPENIAEAIRTVPPLRVDVASGVESSPGKKDPGKLRASSHEVTRANRQLTSI